MENKIEKKNISVSVLGVNKQEEFLNKLKEVVQKNNLEDVIVHYDIMDSVFVKSEGVDVFSVQKANKLGFYTDAHLMVEEPMKYISKLTSQGINSITVHYEIENLHEVLLHLKKLKISKKIKNVGLAVKCDSDISNIQEYFYLIDMILVMSVEPGYGGQAYIKSANDKLRALKYSGKILQVDGGVNIDTITDARKNGATSFVVGSYLTKSIENLEENLLNIRNKMYDEKG